MVEVVTGIVTRMSQHNFNGNACGAESAKCLARSVTDVLAEGPALEAVTFNRQRKTISVATLGQVDVPKITERVA